ncbi:hypothetical protein [Collimonas silvisoli]|uniref:hypothetical protein n=1 Tax=Collimonas silvisoli TaxID=2825884 RepID=UPI001B8AE267|nr:hypothetical protein [Collimonas silvisoli]
MNGNLPLILTCFSAGLLGAAAGAMLAWWLERAWIEAKFEGRLEAKLEAKLEKRLQAALAPLLQSQAEQERLAAQNEERHASELQMVLQALAKQTGKSASLPLTERRLPHSLASPQRPQSVATPPNSSSLIPGPASASTAIAVRPPELPRAPIVPHEPVQIEEEPTRELTDEELDAMPPELPTAEKPRKRIMPTPKKPTFRSL